jgi:hypothetical protein
VAALTTLFFATFLFVNTPLAFLGAGQSDASNKSTQPKQPAIVDLPTVPDGASRVWLDTASNLYRCSYERQFGKSKKGQYLTERQARNRGARPFNKKGCPSR